MKTEKFAAKEQERKYIKMLAIEVEANEKSKVERLEADISASKDQEMTQA